MSAAMESHSENSPHPGTVQDAGDKLCSAMQNGQYHVLFADSVNNTDVDTTPATAPLLSERHVDGAPDDSGDASEELSSDSDAGSLMLLKTDGGTSVGDETSCRIALQVFFPYLIAGFGMVGAGAVLEIVKVCMVNCVCVAVHVFIPEQRPAAPAMG